MTLDQFGRAVLPHLDAILGEAIEYLLATQQYVQAWRAVLHV